jgi:hypothetical protein
MCALILADRGPRLGFEYVAPRASRERGKQPFIHSMAEMKESLAAVGADNLGFRLAEPNNADLRGLPMDEALANTAAAMKKAFGEI